MLDRSLEDTLPYLFALLGIEEQPSPLQQMDPQIRRRRTFEALKKLFLRESLNQPLILIFEDLHWIDSETQGFLDVLSESVASARILLLANYRPEYRHEWGSKTYYTQLRLVPFGEAEAEEFLEVLLGATGETVQTLSLQALKQLILEKTEGSPFFMEEVVQTLSRGYWRTLCRGIRALPARARTLQRTRLTSASPSTVQGILAARIDRLAPDEKAFLQQLAVIGREFSFELVRQVIAQPEDDLSRMLSALQHKEFLYEQPAFPEVEYIFKHALTQEVAYNSVLIERRKVLHEQTGQTIEGLFSDRLEEHYGELAHHYSRSGNTEKAIEYLQQGRATSRATLGSYRGYQSLHDSLRPAQDVTGYVSTWAAGALFAAYSGRFPASRERAFCSRSGNRIRTCTCPLSARRRRTAAFRGSARFVATPPRPGRFSGSTRGRRTTTHHGRTYPRLGDAFGSAPNFRKYFALAGRIFSRTYSLAQTMNLYDQRQHGSLNSLYGGADPGIVCLCELSRVLWFLGYPEQALLKSQSALTLRVIRLIHSISASR